MKTIHNFLFIQTLSLLFFFCSNSPFDSETDLGKKTINTFDSTLTLFDGKHIKDSLTITNVFSFIDTSDSIKSAINNTSDFAIGTWKNERSMMYLEFSADSLDSIMKKNGETNKKLHSFSFLFSVDDQRSTSFLNQNLEIGYCRRKSKNTYIDTTKFIPISLMTLNKNTGMYTIPLSFKFLLDTNVVLDTNTIRLLQMVDSTTLYNYKNDSLLSTSLLAETLSLEYDSITPLASLILAHTLLSDTTSTVTILDTTTRIDTVRTIKTSFVYTIRKVLQHIIIQSDTLDTVFFDTTQYSKSIVRQTIIQKSKIFPKITIKTHLSDSIQQEINNGVLSRYISLYVRLKTNAESSLLFFEKEFTPRLNIMYHTLSTDSITDTTSLSILPSTYDFTVFETYGGAHFADTSAYISGAAGRFVVFELDFQPLWKEINDQMGNPLYKNIPKAELTVFPKLSAIHTSISADSSVPFRYTYLPFFTNNIEDIKSYRLSSPLKFSTPNMTIQLENYLLETHQKQIQNPKGYIYVWLNNSYFAHIRWMKLNKLPFEYVVLNSQ